MISKLRDKGKWVFFSILPGFLLWASFPPMGETMDSLFALAPILWLARRESKWESAKKWFYNGIFFWIATLAWMPAIVKNGGPWPLVALGWGALAAYSALYFGAFGWLASAYWSWVRNDGARRGYGWRLVGLVVVEPVLWAGLEIVRSRFGGGFAWNQLGVAPINAGFGSPAALGGVYLLSALVVLINGTIASIAERMWKSEAGGVPSWARSVETILPFLIAWGVFAAGNQVVGDFIDADAGMRRPPFDDQSRRPPLRVALIQRNFPSVFERDREEDPLTVYKNLLSTVAPLKPDLVVTPESALNEFGEIGSRQARRWGDWVIKQTGAAGVLAGGSREADGKIYNSAALYLANGAEVWYDKVHLVPFGEFIPLDKLIPALQKLAPVGSCTPGELKILPFKEDIKLGVAICYEDTDSAQMRRLAEMGADALVFITNDSWFSRSDETVQHAWQALARAIETGLPVVRVGNSGVTGTIRPDGRASWLTSPSGRPLVDAAASMFDRVSLPPRARRLTPYVICGDKPLFFAFLLLITTMSVIQYYNANEKRRKLSL